SVLQQGCSDHARIRKLVRQRSWAFRLFCQQILDHARVAPAQQPIKIAKFVVELVVFRRSDQNYFHQTQRALANRVRQRANSCVGADPLAVHHAGVQELPRDPAVHIRPGDHQWSEEVALPAFIHTDMGLEHLWRMHFLISQLRFAQNFRLQLELHELLDTAALHEDLWPLLVNRHAQFVFLRKEQRVLLRRKFESELFKQRAKLCCLLFRERVSVRIHWQTTSNAQRSTLNSQLSTLNSEFDVGRSAFDVLQRFDVSETRSRIPSLSSRL